MACDSPPPDTREASAVTVMQAVTVAARNTAKARPGTCPGCVFRKIVEALVELGVDRIELDEALLAVQSQWEDAAEGQRRIAHRGMN